MIVDPVCIDRAIIGTEKHLCRSDDGYRWSLDVPQGYWHLSGDVKTISDKCLDSLLKLAFIELKLAPPQQYVTAIELFISNVSKKRSLPWRHIMPERIHRAFVKSVLEQVTVAMSTIQKHYYEDTWVPGNAVLESLQPIKIDPRLWLALMHKGDGNINALETFEPNADGYADPIKYNRFGTKTGRLTVEKGPMILTINKEFRSIFTSSYDDGRIMMLDFAALEVRVLLYEAGKRCDDVDLYGSIAKDLGYPRDMVKIAVISELYGSSKFALGKQLQIEGKELNAFVKRIKNYFNVNELLQRIKTQFINDGFIVNRYGRKILVDEPLDNIFVAHYAQSSGADVVMTGFSHVVKHLSIDAPKVKPLCLIHDALFLDVPKESIETVQAIDHVKVKGYVQRFPLRHEFLHK